MGKEDTSNFSDNVNYSKANITFAQETQLADNLLCTNSSNSNWVSSQACVYTHVHTNANENQKLANKNFQKYLMQSKKN